VLMRYVPGSDPTDRTFLAPDLVTWVRRFDDAWHASFDEVVEEIEKQIPGEFFNDEWDIYHVCLAGFGVEMIG